MTTVQNSSRRQFIQSSAVVGGGLFSGGLLVGCATMADKGPTALAPSATGPGVMTTAWVKVGTDNAVTIICARAEMGQGVFTSMPMLVAEEIGRAHV